MVANSSGRASSDDYVVNVNKKIHRDCFIIEVEKRCIRQRVSKARVKEEPFELVVPRTWGLLEAIDWFLELADKIRTIFIHKAWGLLHVDIFFNGTL